MLPPLRSLAVAATVAAWLPPVVFAARWADYRASRDYISELGAVGAPDAAAVNAAFAMAGALVVALCVGLVRARPYLRLPLGLVSAVGWSYMVAALAPCDSGCPADGSARQALHNAAGALGYLAGGLGLMMARRPLAARGQRALAWSGLVAGAGAILGLVAMGSPELADTRGLWQRIVELAVFCWLVATAWTTSASSDRRPTSGRA
jgi:hypothetical protein